MKKILIISGWIGSENIFYPIANNFKDENIKFINFKNIRSQYNILDIVEENIKNFEPDIIIAWSMGTLALLKVLENIAIKSKLVLISSTHSFIKRKDMEFGLEEDILNNMINALVENKKIVLKRFYKNMLSTCEKEFFKDLENDFNIVNNEFSVNSLLNGLLFLKDTSTFVKNIKNKSIIIHGEKDNICSLDGAIILNKIMSNSKIEILKDTGHIPFITNTEKFINTLNKFLKDV